MIQLQRDHQRSLMNDLQRDHQRAEMNDLQEKLFEEAEKPQPNQTMILNLNVKNFSFLN